MKCPVRNVQGDTVEQLELEDRVFALPFNEAVVHQAMVRQLANGRQGTADTKTRGEVSGSTRKVYRQKHTGRARRGSLRSPLLRGGGVVFGPHPRGYGQRMPRKMRRLAIKCLLSAKASAGELVVVDQLPLKESKTVEMAQVLRALDVKGSALVVTPKPEAGLVRAARNLPRTKTSPAALLNVVDLLSHKFLVITVDGVRCVEDILTRERCASRSG
ncbi:MAG: 50S ribosomal protein L4 [Chloroflexi bacterium]|nr:50S ribosomal protein L4 [Chloroflexota bacterium]